MERKIHGLEMCCATLNEVVSCLYHVRRLVKALLPVSEKTTAKRLLSICIKVKNELRNSGFNIVAMQFSYVSEKQ